MLVLIFQEHLIVVCTLEVAAVDLIVDKLVLEELVELVVVEQEEEQEQEEQLLELPIQVVEAVEKEHFLLEALVQTVVQE
tara:strand:- start:68 stop:307 length:240 start_codon:yes stop_codon:yes gene_type:complete